MQTSAVPFLLRAAALCALFLCFGRGDAQEYCLIVDAGSSGSRLKMYHHTKSGLSEIFPKEEDEDKFEIEPGVSSYASKPGDVGAALKPLLDAAAKYIPEHLQGKSPLWVKATAGMRLVPRPQIKEIFSALDKYLGSSKNCPFDYKSSEVIGGEEEAVFAWISMNYMLGQIYKGEKVTQGVLDMGGASMQVAFNPGVDIMSHEFPFYANRKRISVYAKSFIKFGLAEVMTRAKARAASDAKGKEPVPFPCFNKGYSEKSVVNGTEMTFKGTGEADACEAISLSLLHLDTECLLEPCVLMGTHMAPVQKHKTFWGLANFFYIANGLNLIGWNEAKKLTTNEIRAAAKEFCGKELEDAKAFSKAPWKYKKNHCLGGLYMAQVLKSYGMEGGDEKVIFARKVHGKSADWTLGAALFETQFMPLELSSRPGQCDCEEGAGKTEEKWTALPKQSQSQLQSQLQWPASASAAFAAQFALLAGVAVMGFVGGKFCVRRPGFRFRALELDAPMRMAPAC